MAEEIPVYLFTGFMDSGKTSLIKDTIFENDFANGSKGLIIMCEDGDVEYDMDKLKAANIQVAEIDSEDEFTAAKLNELNMQYLPEQVFIEYNGTWGIDKIIEAELPKGWVIVQSLATVDSTTFDLYMNNMRAMMQEQVFASDVVIFNRTDDDTDRGHLRRTIKNINRKAQIVYERKDGTIDERPEELPFDINQDVIELSDADYAIWYMDAMENYKKYDGKVVKFLALVYNPDKLRKGVMVPGRFAMTCCIEDVTFIGFKCKYEDESSIPHKSWITITARVHVEFAREYKGKMNSEIAKLTSMREDELFEAAKNLQVPFELVKFVHDNGKLPVVNFAAGGVATPADAALMMQLGAEGVFVGSGIFKSGDPAKRAAAIVKAVTNFTDAKLIAELSEDLGEAMVGINESEIKIIMEERGK